MKIADKRRMDELRKVVEVKESIKYKLMRGK